MSSKQAILQALSTTALSDNAMPVINIPARLDDLLSQFETSLNTVTATLHRDGGLTGLQAEIDKLSSEGKQIISLVDGVTGNREVPADPHELHDIDYAIIKGHVGVAENGCIWVNNESVGHRVTPFICENLLIVLAAEDVCANMHIAVQKVEIASGQFGTFISGPSKTADIEQSLVVGAHGACSLNVYLV
ncbi:LutC/YkgG family protein [Shewanella marina]|uniref:LutC/YkgG family protein n=1 Tax=Shewanella marina TaxID=487319 RepID=UPI00046F545C|nr:LUD domain-containing protein [Shewanella marina]